MAHLDTILVKSGDNVKKGQQIGTVGNSGLDDPSAVHLHLEIYDENGNAIDPRSVMNLPTYTGTDDGGTYAVNRKFVPGGGGGVDGYEGDGGSGDMGFGMGTSAAQINVQALKSMGLKEEQIKALTNTQQYLGEMSDIMALAPLLMGMGIDGKGGGGGGGGGHQHSAPRGSDQGHKVSAPPTGDPGSSEKVAMSIGLHGQLSAGQSNWQRYL